MEPLRLLVAYDGSEFSGFQVQPDRRTIQGELERCLQRIGGEPVRVRGAGRTDAGVHALGQVISLDGWDGPAPDQLLRALAGGLPRDISVLDVQRGPVNFDARRSALWRSYVYLIWNGSVRHPLYDRFLSHVPESIDVRAIGDALSVVEGAHDFSSFARVRSDQQPVRRVRRASVATDGSVIRITITADAFLHQMVRSIVGSALEVGTGRRSRAWMREVLLARDRAAAGQVAPAKGLTLVDVSYEQATWPRRPALTWPWSAALGSSSEAVGGLA